MADEGRLVLDASALVDVLLGGGRSWAVRARIADHELHAPAHLHAEVLSALGRLQRAGVLPIDVVTRHLEVVAAAPIVLHPLPDLLLGAWARRERLRLVDALYVELAHRLDALLITTDAALGRATDLADVISLEGGLA